MTYINDVINEALYLLEEWERGADVDEYVTNIWHLRQIFDVYKKSQNVESAPNGLAETSQDVACKEHPNAPHGFMRGESINAGHYVCECAFWEPEDEDEQYNVKFVTDNATFYHKIKTPTYYIAKHSDEDLQAAVLAEREACIKLLEDFSKTGMAPVKDTWRMGLIAGANAIRGRKE